MQNKNNNEKTTIYIHLPYDCVRVEPYFAIPPEYNSSTTKYTPEESSCMKEQFMQLAEIAVAEYLKRKRNKKPLC